VLEEKLPPEETLGALRNTLAQTHGARLATVLTAASFLVDGVSCRGDDYRLPTDATIDVLPPFAGG
jgi:molybdopterin converting factor small subunit